MKQLADMFFDEKQYILIQVGNDLYNFCKFGSTIRLIVMCYLLTTNNWLNNFPDHALMTVQFQTEGKMM